jgi:predicted acyltransferase
MMDHHQMVLALGFAAGALYITSHYMKTMVPLRLCEIGANILFVGYGWFYPVLPAHPLRDPDRAQFAASL